MERSDRSVLARAFRVLGAFGPGRYEMTLAELTEATGLPRATVHRLASQLATEGALAATRRGWRVGIRLFELGQLVPTQQRLREVALPYLSDLYEATHGTVHLAVLDGGEVLYVEILSGHRKVASPSRRGGRMPAHCTAVGKALLAFSGVDVAAEGPPLERRTTKTITDREVLVRTLHDVRRTAVAYDGEEARLGLACAASPVLDRKGLAVAAISVSLATGDDLTPRQVAPAVRTAALALSRELSRR